MKSLLLLPLLFLLAACATSPSVPPDPSILRVGITPDSPPLIYTQMGGGLAGVEVDFAKRLAPALDRELRFVELAWGEQFDALEENRIDIVMSGMSVTRARAFRVHFTYPYMTAGLTPLFRRDDFAPAGMLPSIVRHQTGVIGCVRNTTGAIFTRNAYVHATLREYPDWSAAVEALKRGEVGMLIHDAPVVWWTVSRDEDTLAAFADLLNREDIAWAVAKTNPELLEEVNAVMKRWKEEGVGVDILKRWFPQL